MRKFKFKLFILSAILLTLSSGLLFYRNLFMSEVINPKGKNNFEELRYLDLRVNELMASERRHLNSDLNEQEKDLTLAQNNIHDIVSIVLDLHLKNPQIKNSIFKIENYFKDKLEKTTKFQVAIKDLKTTVTGLAPLYREMQKRNLKFAVDGKDFYKECITDSYLYLLIPTKENEAKLLEDKKILTQIIGIATKPDELVQKYAASIESLMGRHNEIEEILTQIKAKSIDEEMTYVGNYFHEANTSQNSDGQFFLVLIFTAIIIYIISIIVILRKF